MELKTISVIGLGYIGLPTAAMFASYGKTVIGIDVNKDIVDTINKGKIHIVEPELDVIVADAVKEGRLRASLVAEPADAFLIAVPTPFVINDVKIPTPDLRYIEEACKSIACVLKKGDLVILESTSPVGATEMVVRWLAELRKDLMFPKAGSLDHDIFVAHCPERVLPGNVVKELVDNDRVIGGITDICSEKALELYKTFVKGYCIKTNARTAEMAKLTENASRDVSIAFANELSFICDEMDIDVWELISLANRHPRVNILQPGPGVGGHCIAVDPWFIVSNSPKSAKLIRTAREVNDSKPEWVVDKVKVAVADFLSENQDKTIGDVKIVCYGLAFKPDIDDLRESPSLVISKKISQISGSSCYAVEPNIENEFLVPHLKLINYEKAKNFGDVHVLLVDHYQFKDLGPSVGKIIDTKGIWRTCN